MYGPQAIKILQSEEPPRGNYPVGGFHSSASVNQDFFTLEEKEAHSTQLVKHMPFLYKTLIGILNPNNMVFPVEPEESPSSENNNPEGAAREDIPEDIASIAYEDSHQGPEGHHRRLETVSYHSVSVICGCLLVSLLTGFASPIRLSKQSARWLHFPETVATMDFSSTMPYDSSLVESPSASRNI
jgi:hypothetical protein